jgi:hypothetical protein
MVYKYASLMIQGIADTLEEGDVVVCSDEPRQLLIGFAVDRPGSEPHRITVMSLKKRLGLNEDFKRLIVSGQGRRRMAWAMTHRHQFSGHGCEECAKLELAQSVMES